MRCVFAASAEPPIRPSAAATAAPLRFSHPPRPTAVSPRPSLPSQRQFTFDYVFDSFTEEEDKVATQRVVWDAIGAPVLEAAWGGYNVSLFAYGQTGSGKSHSMVGFDHTDKVRRAL